MGQRWTLHGHYIYYYCMNGRDHNGKVMTWTETGANATVTPGKAVVEDPVSKKKKNTPTTCNELEKWLL